MKYFPNSRIAPSLVMLLRALFAMIFFIPAAFAANNPGHDTLYIEEQGSSTLNGTLNISRNLQIADLLYNPNIDFLGNTSTPSHSRPEIYAVDANSIYINAMQSIYLAKDAGSMVYVGGSSIPLNVSGNLYVYGSVAKVNNKDICLSDGTNCISSTNTGNVTSINVSSGPLTINSTTGNVLLNITIPTCTGTQKLSYDGSAFSCDTDEEGSGPDGTGGWTNTTTNTWTTLAVNTTGNMKAATINATTAFYGNLNASYVQNAPWLTTTSYQSSAAGWTNSSAEASTGLSVNLTAGNLSFSSSTRICFNANCSVYRYYNGSCVIDQGVTSRVETC